MPDRWHRKLSAVRSAVRIDASGPRDVSHGRRAADLVAVVGPTTSMLDGRVDLGERLGGRRAGRRARRRCGGRAAPWPGVVRQEGRR